jgi:hypothetical protein
VRRWVDGWLVDGSGDGYEETLRRCDLKCEHDEREFS